MSKYLLEQQNEADNIEINQFEKLHRDLVEPQDFDLLIEKVCTAVRAKGFEFFNAQIWRDSFLGSLRRIKLSKINFDQIPFDHKTLNHDLRTIWLLGFFQNTKVFLEVIKTNFDKYQRPDFSTLIYEVTLIRNCLAHDYNKEFDKNLYVVRIDPNHHFNKGLIKLEKLLLDSSTRDGHIYVSLKYFYVEIRNILKDLIEFIENT